MRLCEHPALLAAALGVLLAASPALAAGDLAIKATKLEPLEIGGGDAGYGVSNDTYELEMGKSYRLEIKQVGPHGCEWDAAEFSRNIWLRKIDVGHVSIDTPTFESFDLDEDTDIEITFVPIRTGEFSWECEGLDEQGMEGTFVVK
ncbi:hypothetical protein HDIA_0919 [Hartmannibacter diazotrophicus]|uniref:Copper-binding protein n=1 Tax=Hartmannibacter diazotrophicus TaxID=1482074 RepID=A0A2C9D2H8_9HYPH|nr:copper-binding protein [Hartmannibacter diazotrophicus]SON54460.1 hypothetical protein HDIA_0919 [Hartmannibacter diazotrophicus]